MFQLKPKKLINPKGKSFRIVLKLSCRPTYIAHKYIYISVYCVLTRIKNHSTAMTVILPDSSGTNTAV